MPVAGPTDHDDDGDVIASLDGEDGDREFVLADVTEDGAWIAMAAGEAPILSAWR